MPPVTERVVDPHISDLWRLEMLLCDMEDVGDHRFGKLPRITQEQFCGFHARRSYARALIDAIRDPDWTLARE